MTRRTILFGVLILLLVGTLLPPAEASSSPVILSANITDGVVHASVNLNMFQNITAYRGSFALPQFSGLIQGSNLTVLTGMVQAALRAKDPSAKAENLALRASTSPWMNSSSIQWFNVSLSFDVRGVQTDTSGSSRVDMAWKSFAVPSDVTVGGYEVNNIGAGYLVGVASQLANASQGGPGSPVRFQFLVNGHPLLPRDFPSLVRNVETLNFSTINTPVSKWTLAYESGNFLNWSFKGGLLGAEISVIIAEPGVSTRTFYGLFYRMTSKVTAPMRSVANGDSITVVFSDAPETLMAISILSVSVLGVVAFFSERRLFSGFSRKRQRR